MNMAPVGLRGLLMQRQQAGQEQNNQLAQAQGLLAMNTAQLQQGALQQQQAEKLKQQAQIEDFARTLPVDQQPAFRVDPIGFMKMMNETKVVTPGASIVRGGVPTFTAPALPKEKPVPQIVDLMQRAGIDPESDEGKKILLSAVTKTATHAPAATVTNYAPGALVPGKSAANKVDENLLDTGMRLQKLSAIEAQFRPEFQEIGTRLNAAWLAGADKFGMKLNPSDRAKLTDFSAFKRNSIDAMNEYIKSITGAAMSEQEAQRILKGLPNPGQSIMDGDSPVEFESKLKDAIKQTRLAEARYVYIKRKGMAIGDVPLDKMPSLMNERGQEIEKTIKERDPKMSDTEVKRITRRTLAQEFGLSE